MNCPSCQHQNLDRAKFCAECGSALQGGCGHCGAQLAALAKFCHECGAPVAGAVAAAPRTLESNGARKTVSILFADLAGSTALHERLEAESARRFMENYYAVARAAVEEHGGKVTQFLGDGVLAFFGIPQVAEDDALRAVRAGLAMQAAFATLATQVQATVGETGLRVAINTGEVVAKGETDIIGDPVNVAARLQELGGNGDVVIGEATRKLVADAAELELLGEFALKGRAEAVKTYRVLCVGERTATQARFVGRAKELEQLAMVFDQAIGTPATKLAVLLGSPGLGKSRLLAEFTRQRDDAIVINAHCDAAGGASFEPIAAALRQHLQLPAQATAAEVLAVVEAAVPESDAERGRIAKGVAGILASRPGSPEESFFVLRRFLAGLMAEKPLLLIIDDLQWGEPLLLDLVEHLVQWGRELPLLLLIGARPELRALRSSFTTAGGLVSTVVTLDGLDGQAAMQLAAGVIGAEDLPAAVAAKVLTSSEGNPLFIGALVRMLVDEGALILEGERWRVGESLATVEMPPTIHALLAARIERLQPAEATLLERAAVIGRQFSRSALAALLPGDDRLDTALESLQRAELIERDQGWLLGEPVLRFHHLLIRDAAYRRLLKGTRAELHEQLADWIEAQVGEATEHDEMIGRHLEDAHRLLAELGPLDTRGEVLGERAARRLAAAGRRALAADDVELAAALLGRARRCLAEDDDERPALLIDCAEALLSAGEVGTADEVIGELAQRAGDSARLQAWQRCLKGHHTVLTAPRELEDTVSAVAAAATTLASEDDPAGEAKAHYVHALALVRQGQIGACEAALDRALAAARKAEDRRQANAVLALAPLAALWGPSPVTRASGRCLDVVRVLRITQGAPAVEAVALSCQGVLEALRGRTEAAHRMIASGREMVEELGISQHLYEADVYAGYVSLLEQDLPAAEARLRKAYEGLRELGLGIDAARAAALLARTRLAQGNIDEALELSRDGEALAGDDLKAAIAWRGVRAEALAVRGEHDDAITLAQKAVKIAAATDALLDHAEAQQALAAALRAAGRAAEADQEAGRARAIRADKGVEIGEIGGKPPVPDQAGESGAPASAKNGSHPHSLTTVGGDHGRGPRPHVPHNAAFTHAQRFKALAAAHDAEGMRALFAGDYIELDHTTGASIGVDGSVASMAMLFRSSDAHFQLSPVATLGPSLGLARRELSAGGAVSPNHDVGPYTHVVWNLVQTNAAGLAQHGEVFTENGLGDAIAQIYRLYAESLPKSSAEGTRATTTANAIEYMLTDSKRFTLEQACDPDLSAVDHRVVGYDEVDNYAQRWTDSWEELAQDVRFGIDTVLGLSTDTLLRMTTARGRWKNGGGSFEIQYLMLSHFGASGRLIRTEFFESQHVDQALARFAELSGTDTPDDGLALEAADSRVVLSTRQGVAPNVARRVQPNAVFAGIARFTACAKAGDWAGLRAVFSDDATEIDHQNGIEFSADELVSSTQLLFGGPHVDFWYEPIATLGARLYLGWRCARGSGTESSRYDVSDYEITVLSLVEINEQGLYRRGEVFGPNKLGEAVARLYAAYADSLPEGTERERAQAIARSVEWLLTDNKTLSLKQALSPKLKATDHRALVGHDTVGGFRQRIVDVVNELMPDVQFQLRDILAVAPEVLLRTTHVSGHWKLGGGEAEAELITLSVFGADGRQTELEFFDLSQEELALARFDELTRADQRQNGVEYLKPDRAEQRRGRSRTAKDSETALPARVPARPRVRPNRATRHAERAVATAGAGDFAAMRALFTNDHSEIDHPSGRALDADGIVASTEGLMRAQAPFFRLDPVASLGDALALVRREAGAAATTTKKFDVGPSENVSWLLIEADASGRSSRGEVFAEDRLGEAISRLYRRYAELLPQGAKRALATKIADSAEWTLTDSKRFEVEDVVDANLEGIDHRLVGHDLVDDYARRWRASWDAVTDDRQFRINELFALSPNALLRSATETGTWKESGGRFETQLLTLSVFGTDGRQCRVEFFEPDRLEQALARFVVACDATEQLTPEIDTLDEAINARDWAAARGMFREDFVELDHSNGRSFSVEQMIESSQRLFRSREPWFRHEPIATLSPQLHLTRRAYGASGAEGKRYPVGAYEHRAIVIGHTDDDGRYLRAETFAEEQLGRGLLRLYECYAEMQPPGAARQSAQRIAAGLAVFHGPIDTERMAAALARNVVLVDHRVYATWTSRDAAEMLQQFEAQMELAPDLTARIDEVLALTPSATLLRMTYHGTGLESGGLFENCFCVLRCFNAEGRVSRIELFEREDLERARARFAELSADQSLLPPARNAADADNLKAATAELDRSAAAPSAENEAIKVEFSNAVTRLFGAGARYFEARDWEAFAALFAKDLMVSDRRSLIQLEFAGKAKWLEYIRQMGDLPNTRLTQQVLATRGERLALRRLVYEGSGGDVGTSQIPALDLIEVNAEGKAVAFIRFDENELDAAFDELDARYDSGEGACITSTISRYRELFRLRDWHAIADFVTSDFVEHDYRPIGLLGTREGGKNWADTERALVELAPDTQVRIDHTRFQCGFALTQATFHGTREGGHYEIRMLLVSHFNADGKMYRNDIFEPEQIDTACAHISALQSGSNVTVPIGHGPASNCQGENNQ